MPTWLSLVFMCGSVLYLIYISNFPWALPGTIILLHAMLPIINYAWFAGLKMMGRRMHFAIQKT